MKIPFSSISSGIGLLAVIALVNPNSAFAFTIGQNSSNEYADNLYGQGFTPNQIGLDGSGSAPLSGSVTLSAFTLAYDAGGARTPASTLYIYDFFPTLAQIGSGTGALFTSTSFADLANDAAFGFPSRTFSFANVPLEASQKYFALAPGEQSLRYTFGQNPYSGGSLVLANVSALQETGSLSDVAFRAVLVPFEFSPVSGLIIGTALFCLQRFKRSRA
jgi:hypothetical protein